MEYEVKHNGRPVGTLRVNKEGLMTVFEARTRRLEGLQRLWVCGEDKKAYLGVLAPAEGELCLRKKLSRRDMADFPISILYASTAGPDKKEQVEPETEPKKEPKKEPETEQERSEVSNRNETAPEEMGMVWQPSSMGTLVAIENGIIYTAIPAKLRRVVAGVHLETINGEKYVIFRRSC